MPGDPLSLVFFRIWAGTSQDATGVGERLAAAVAQARAAFPAIALADEAFVRHLAARADAAKRPLDALAVLRTDDLFLAAACAAGDHEAILRFELEHVRWAERGLTKRGISADAIEEAKQNVRERLLVGSETAKILDYDGRGDLRQWVRVVLLREAILLSKREKREKRETPDTFDFLSLPDRADDPEIAYFKRRYRAEYKEAFTAALLGLSARERALLRQQYILGLNVDEIGTMYQVHRATAARWVQGARETLLSNARLELAHRLGLARAEIEAIVRMIDSQLEVSLGRILAVSTSRLSSST
jgi:RNA polymerase sigma-70 factor (ECF subfamily)